MDCEGSSYQKVNPITIEVARIALFVRYNYYKNNYIELDPFLSSFIISGYSDAFLPKLGLSTGLEVSIFYGWNRLKIGTGIRLSTLFFKYSSNNPANNNVTGVFLRPLIIHYHL